jgi:2'-5' RNA ligase
MRTFVAIELDEPCRAALAEALQALRGLPDAVRWVRPEQLHLTLKFIGDMAQADLAATVEALARAGADVPPFSMAVGGIGGFPAAGRPRVVHVDVREPGGALVRLQQNVETALAEAVGLKKERRRYVPHITLGRVRRQGRCGPVDELARALETQQFGTVDVGQFVLMRSDLRPEGAVHTPLGHFPLGS